MISTQNGVTIGNTIGRKRSDKQLIGMETRMVRCNRNVGARNALSIVGCICHMCTEGIVGIKLAERIWT